jgi:hypothetical protein
MDTIQRERNDCDQLLKKIDPSTMILWIDPRTGLEEGPAMRNCTARFTMPSSDPGTDSDQLLMNATADAPVSTPGRNRSLIESLYCYIQRFFGARC